MVNENLMNLINNKKPVELVQELKDEYKIPSFEEFMESYENDDNLNYDDLSGGDIGTQKAYGPCSNCSGSNRNLKFKLKIVLLNCIGDEKGCEVHNISDARDEARKIKAETGHWTDYFWSYFSQEDRRKLFDKIKEKIDYHKRGNEVDTYVCNKKIPSLEEVFESWAETELDRLDSEPYPGDRGGGRNSFLD